MFEKKILVVAAHPDDEVLGCGGTLNQNKNKIIQILFLSDGVSSRGENLNNEIKSRKNSAIKFSKTISKLKPIFLNFPDNSFDRVKFLDIVQEIEKVIQKFKPDTILTHSSSDLNIDHQITHKAVMTACRPQPNFCVKEIYSFETLSATHWQSPSMKNVFNPNYFVGVSDFMDKKIKALQCYDNEMREAPHARSYESVENLSKFRGSLVGVKNAEAFCVERIVEQ